MLFVWRVAELFGYQWKETGKTEIARIQQYIIKTTRGKGVVGMAGENTIGSEGCYWWFIAPPTIWFASVEKQIKSFSIIWQANFKTHHTVTETCQKTSSDTLF